MEAIFLAMLVGLALDIGDRSQRLAVYASTIPVCLIVLASSALAAALGVEFESHLRGSAGLLFFALAMILGASGLLLPYRKHPGPEQRPARKLGVHGKLLLYRLADGPFFLLIAVAAMTGNGWGTAAGGALGGGLALLPPVLAGPAFERALPLQILRPIVGGVLVLAGLMCGVSALGLA